MNKKELLRICSFTENGNITEGRIVNELDDYRVISYKKGTPIMDFCKEAFIERSPLIFVGAMGIATRSIAPFIKDKLQDPPVLVLDELGNYVIPILSGHFGGGNQLAEKIAESIGAAPIITTATDINKAFSVDVFAREKNLLIDNREGITKVSTKALGGKPVTISIKDYPPKEDVDVLVMDEPRGFLNLKMNNKGELWKKGLLDSGEDKGIIVGIGCRKGKAYEELKAFLDECLYEYGLSTHDISGIGTIDIKQREECIVKLSRELSIPIMSFDAETLSRIKGSVSSSDFVMEKVGVDNVCERAALAVLGEKGNILMPKRAKDGMTLAFSRKTHVDFRTIYVVGMGPGAESAMTHDAEAALDDADVIVGYTVYLDLLRNRYPHKEMLSTPMKQEIDRCRLCFDEAEKGKRVAMVCSGDAGIYGMASIMYEIMEEYQGEWNLEIIPGITAASSGAAILGAPLNHDFAVISLSDLLTPWEKIEMRLRSAASGDFAIAIYNPSSKKRKDYLKRACNILMESIEKDRPCGYVKNIGREGTESHVCTLEELKDMDVDMFTTVFIGNSQSRIINGKLVTPRGYRL